jgi:hypothetical protein
MSNHRLSLSILTLRCIDKTTNAVQTKEEWWCEAVVHRVAGEITLLERKPDFVKAKGHFDRASPSATSSKPSFGNSAPP